MFKIEIFFGVSNSTTILVIVIVGVGLGVTEMTLHTLQKLL